MAAKNSTKKIEASEPKKRRVSPRGCKQKGTKWEKEVCDIMSELGIPTQRVVASGAHKFSGAESDLKIGIVPNPDGSYPPADETAGIMRGECKNLAATPGHYWESLEDANLDIVMSTRPGVEANWKHLKQSKSNKVVALRRPKVPSGAVANKQYDEIGGFFVPMTVMADLLRRAYPDRVFYAPQSSGSDNQEGV